MNTLIFATLLCIGAVSANYGAPVEEGQWKGEGLAESQDYGQYNQEGQGYANQGYANQGYAGQGARGSYAPAPLGQDGRVVDTPEVAAAKAAHYAATASANGGSQGYAGQGYAAPAQNYGNQGYAAQGYAAQGSYAAPAQTYSRAPAPLGHDGRVVDTPEVAAAKAAHYAAVNSANH